MARGVVRIDRPRLARPAHQRRARIVADPASSQVALRLMNGVIHSRPQNAEQYQKISFTAYDLKLSVSASLYGAEERTPMEVIRAKLESSGWTDTNALRRLMEYYKDLAFPAASLVFCILGVPVGIVSKRSGSIGGFAVGVIVVIVYYVLNVACEFLVTTLWISPFPGAWLPNVIFALATIFWFYRVSRQ